MKRFTVSRNWSIARIAALQKRMTLRDVARLCGYSPGHFYNVLGGFSNSARARKKIERVLGLKRGTLQAGISSRDKADKTQLKSHEDNQRRETNGN